MVQGKTVSKLVNLDQVEKMLQHFETYKFIKTTSSNIQFSFLTETLKELVRKEWLQSNIVASDWPAFLFDGLNKTENLKAALEATKSLVSTPPFSIIGVSNLSNEKEEESSCKQTTAVDLVSSQFKKQIGTVFVNQTFCPAEKGVEIFHKKQRLCKNWWRKFSAVPGRFVTCNTNNNLNGKSLVCEIQAEFPWGLETVEIIKYLPDFGADNNYLFEEVSKSKKKKLPHVVTCEGILENMTFTYLCDSYEKLNGESNRDVLMLNRKLAPFKVAIAGSGSTSESKTRLEELSLLLAKNIRKLGISVLFLPDALTASVEKQLLRNDALGIPYTLLFNDKTLQDGIIALRSRDTTLKEDSHVSLITEYLGKILN